MTRLARKTSGSTSRMKHTIVYDGGAAAGVIVVSSTAVGLCNKNAYLAIWLMSHNRKSAITPAMSSLNGAVRLRQHVTTLCKTQVIVQNYDDTHQRGNYYHCQRKVVRSQTQGHNNNNDHPSLVQSGIMVFSPSTDSLLPCCTECSIQ